MSEHCETQKMKNTDALTCAATHVHTRDPAHLQTQAHWHSHTNHVCSQAHLPLPCPPGCGPSWEMNVPPGPSCCTWAPEGYFPRRCFSHSLLVFQGDNFGNALFLVSCHNLPFAHQLPGLRARIRVPPTLAGPSPVPC